MKLLRRRLFSLLAAVSLLLSASLTGLWAASYRYGGDFRRRFLRDGTKAVEQRFVYAGVAWGSIWVEEDYGRMTPSDFFVPDAAPPPRDAREVRTQARRAMLHRLQWQEQRRFISEQVQAENGARPTFYWTRLTKRPRAAADANRLGFGWTYHSTPSVHTHSLKIRLPIWALSLASLVAAILFRALRGRAYAPGMCGACGYLLTGNVSGVCPECGTVIGTRTSP